LRLIIFEGLNRNNDQEFRFNAFDKGGKRVEKESPGRAVRVGESYRLVEFSRRDEFKQLISSNPLASEMNKTTFLNLGNPLTFFRMQKSNEIIGEIPVIENNMREEDVSGNRELNEFFSKFKFGFKINFERFTKRIFFSKIRGNINRIT